MKSISHSLLALRFSLFVSLVLTGCGIQTTNSWPKGRYVTPLVLDFSGERVLKTVNPLIANVTFDLDADGTKEQVGWISSSAGFLVLDVNRNGVIDNGSEMFGEATKLREGGTAADGFSALADVDTNGNGRIDSDDPLYDSLSVWFDDDNNGVSAPQEILDLVNLQVGAIGLGYEALPANQAIQSHGLGASNLVKFRSSFQGPERCRRRSGCFLYDVYFGVVEP